MRIKQFSNAKIVVLVTIFMCLFTCKNNEHTTIDIISYGAVPDGKTVSTEAIQQAIDAANEKGGGKVLIQNGAFVTGSIIMKSNVELHISENATLYGSIDPRHYRKIEVEGMPVSPKTDDNSKLAIILAHDADHISITGKGTIDGRGAELIKTMDSLHEAGIHVIKGYNKANARLRETERPKILMFMESNHVAVRDITIKNSAVWVQTYELCTNVRIDGITVESRAFWNNDGMDISDCRNVQITNCNVNAADDGICLKSYYPGHCNDSIYIANCRIRSSASAVKFGTASIGGFKNVTIKDLKIFDTFRSMIAIESVDGGDIENINVSNLEGVNTGNAFFIRLGHRSGEKPGTVKNITIKDLKCEVPFGRPDKGYAFEGPWPGAPHNQYPVPIAGIPGHYIENVTLENIEITYPGKSSKEVAYIDLENLDGVPEKVSNYPEYSQFGELPSWGFYARHVKGLSMKDIRLKLEDKDFRPPFVFDDVHELSLKNLSLPEDNKVIAMRGVEGMNLDKNLSESVKIIPSHCVVTDSDNSYRFKDKLKVELEAIPETAKIYYSLDGSTPTKKSTLYKGPIAVTQDVNLKAIAIADGYYPSKILSKRYSKSILNHLKDGFPKIVLEEKPDKYGNPDGSQLIDEVFGTADFADRKWTGLDKKDLIVDFDLGQKVTISKIQLSTLASTESWIFPPSSISFWVGNKDRNYKMITQQTYGKLKGHTNTVNTHLLEFKEISAQYLKIKVENYGAIPKWHPASGMLPWIFIDEINLK